MAEMKIGWITPVIGPPESNHVPIVIYQAEHILPTAFQYFDSVWLADHFYGFDRKTDPFLESWTTLTWLAAKFPDVLLCHHVIGHGYRQPALIAKMAATLQELSGGRFILGIGAGWRKEEYLAYGWEFPSTATRIRQLEEVIKICRLMWTEEAPTFEGKYFTIRDAYAAPRPNPLPPVMIGGGGEQIMLPMVGRIADGWNTFPRDMGDWQRKRDIVWRSAEAAGRNPADIEISATREAPLPKTKAESEAWLETLLHWKSLGITHPVLDFGHVTDKDLVVQFAEEVLKPLRAG